MEETKSKRMRSRYIMFNPPEMGAFLYIVIKMVNNLD